MIDECQICFGYGWHKHHISYFPEHIIKICDSCHAVITFSKDPDLDMLRQYEKGDRQKLAKITSICNYRQKKWGTTTLPHNEDPRHSKLIRAKGYF